MVEQLAFEAHAVGADSRGERQPEVGARQPAGQQPSLEQGLREAPRREPLAPLADGLDVVEPAADTRDESEMGTRAGDDLLLAARKERAGELVAQEGQVPGV